MEAFPDPSSGDFVAARAWFQSHAPAGSVPSMVTQNRLDTSVYTWTVTYYARGGFPSPAKFECQQAKARFNSSMSRFCKVRACVAYKANARSEWQWNVTFSPLRRRFTLADFIPCVTVTPSQPEQPKRSQPQTGKPKRNLRLRHCVVELSTGQIVPVSDLSSDSVCKKLLHKGKNVTRHFFGKTRLNNYFKRQILTTPDATASTLKAMAPVKFVPANATDVTSETTPAAPQAGSNDLCPKQRPRLTAVRRKKTTPSPNCSEVGYDYSKLERSYVLSKFKNSIIYRTSLIYLACTGPRSELSKMKFGVGKIPFKSEMENILTDAGLPIDEELYNLFQEYCQVAGITSSAVDLDMSNIFDMSLHW